MKDFLIRGKPPETPVHCFENLLPTLLLKNITTNSFIPTFTHLSATVETFQALYGNIQQYLVENKVWQQKYIKMN